MVLYEPREDSFLLKTWVEKYAKGRVLDMGTGTGIQAITAKSQGCEVLACDINPEAAKALEGTGITFIQSDLFESITGKFDTIIFNPPYLPEEKEHKDIALYSGPNGRNATEKFLHQVKKHLNPNGIVLLVQSTLTGLPETEALLTQLGFEFEVVGSQSFFMEKIVVYLCKMKIE